MNPALDSLQSYPFQKLAALMNGVAPHPELKAISLHIGEPKHPTPDFIRRALAENLAGLASYPTTLGAPSLRVARSAALVLQTVSEGRREMPSFSSLLSAEQIRDVADYVSRRLSQP